MRANDPRIEPLPGTLLQAVPATPVERVPLPPNVQVAAPTEALVDGLVGWEAAERSRAVLPEHLPIRPEFLAAMLESPPGAWVATLGRCRLPDHDVHLLAEGLRVCHHFRPEDGLPERLEAARQLLLAAPPQVIAVKIYTDRLEYLYPDATIAVITCNGKRR